MNGDIPAAWLPFAPESESVIQSRHQARVSREQYEAIEAVNWSTLKWLGKSPEHYLYHLKNKGKDTPARQSGRVVHLAVFEPERLARDVVVYPDVRNGKKWKAFAEKHQGKEIITSRQWDAAKEISERARNHPMAAKYLAGGRAEHAVRWLHQSPRIENLPYWEVECKGRIDFVADAGAIVDLKRTKDASPTGFGREVMRYEHHGQLAFYQDGYEKMTGVRLPVLIVAVEAEAPFVVQVYRVPDEILELGRERYEGLLAHLNVCRTQSNWPGYAGGEMTLELPRWAFGPDEENELDEELVFTE